MLIAWPNRVDQCALSGGAWTTGLPRDYMLTRQLDQRARSVSALKRDTWCYLAAPSAIAMGAAALAGNNFSTAARVRWRGWVSEDPRGALDGLFTGGVLPAGFTVERSTSGTYFGADGLLKTAANNEARIEYTAGVCEGVLVECAASNSLLWCRDGLNEAWSKSSMSATKTATGIDGVANSATTLKADSTNARISQAGTYTLFSVWLRRVSGTGAIKLTGNGFTSTTTVTLTTSWQRFSVARTGNCGIQVDVSGDVIEMDYAQDEEGAIATSPILTTTGFGSRAADTVKYVGASAAGMVFSGGAAMYWAKLLRRPASATSPLFYMPGVSGTNWVAANMTTGGVQQADVTASSAQVSGVNSSAITVGSAFTAALSWAANDVRASYDGGAVVSDTTATMPAVAVSYLSMQGGACYYLRRLKAYPATKTNAQLQGLSGTELELPADADSGWLDAWPSAYLAVTDSETRTGEKTPALYKPGSVQTCRYWRFDVDDESNTSGFVEVGRPFIGSAWQPVRNASYGAAPGFDDRGLSTDAYGGARYFEEPGNPRIYAFSFEALTDAEAWDKVYELLRSCGSTREVLYSWSPDDARNLPRHTFLATLDGLDALTATSYGLWGKAFKVRELL